MHASRFVVVSLALLAPALSTTNANAQNGVKPRIPVSWDAAPACLEYVDRSVNPVYEFEYAIFDEDPSPGEDLLPDEVVDSRTHQFLAFSRQGNPQTEFPHAWLSQADVDAAISKGLITETTVGADETLDTSPLWAGRFVRITPDAERRPIAHESVAAPVEWDTTGVAAGAYQLWGYTWEPAFNEWAQRTGNVVIVHDGDATAVGPAAAVTNGELIVYSDQAAIIEGCVFATEGTTVTGFFSETPPNGSNSSWQPTWVPFAEDVDIDGETFALEFVPGGGHATPTLLVRLVFTDPQGRSYEAYMADLVNVLPGSENGCDTDGGGGGFVGMPGCGGDDDDSGDETAADDGDTASSASGTGGAPATTGSAGSSPTTAPGSDDGGGGGCSVPTSPGQRVTLLLLGLLGLTVRIRSREG